MFQPGDELPAEVPDSHCPTPKGEEELILVQKDERGGGHELCPTHFYHATVPHVQDLQVLVFWGTTHPASTTHSAHVRRNSQTN